MDHILSFHSSADGPLACFSPLAVGNSAAADDVWVFVRTSVSISLSHRPSSWAAKTGGDSMCNVLANRQAIFQRNQTIFAVGSSNLSTISPMSVLFLFFF